MIVMFGQVATSGQLSGRRRKKSHVAHAVLVKRHAELVHRQQEHTDAQRSSLSALKDASNTSYCAHRHVQLRLSFREECLHTYAPMCVNA